jgi:hypothetical protein
MGAPPLARTTECEALRYFKLARELAQKSGDRRSEALSLGESARTSWLLGELQESRSTYDTVLAAVRLIKDRRTETATMIAMAHCDRQINTRRFSARWQQAVDDQVSR